jgi:hypothetical protein
MIRKIDDDKSQIMPIASREILAGKKANQYRAIFGRTSKVKT